MPLTQKDRKHFKAIGHHLKPILQLGDKGLNEAVSTEIDARLEDHELIKVKVSGQDREDRDAIITQICTQTGAELVQRIGHTALLYRAAAKPNPKLSNLLRHGS